MALSQGNLQNPALQPTPQTPTGLQPDQMGQFIQSYLNSQRLQEGFMAPLEKIPDWQAGTTTLDPQVMGLMQAHFGGLTQNPIHTGGANPNLTSILFNALSGGQAQEIQQRPDPYAPARLVYQSTIGAMIDQAKADPLLLAGEILGGVALFAGAAALDVATGGLATPLLWTGFALLAAPTILPATTEAIQNAIANPNDQTISAALITVGLAGLTLGSPIKAFRGIGAQRSLMAAQARQVAFLHQPGQAVNLLTRDRAGNMAQFLLPEDRFPIIPQTLDDLEAEIGRRKAAGEPLEDEDLIAQYRTALKEHDILASNIAGLEMGQAAVEGGERPRGEGGRFRSRQDYLDEVAGKLQQQRPDEQAAVKDMIPIMKTFGHRYGYVLAKENPMGRISPEELRQIPSGMREKADKAFRAVWGIMYAAGEGHGWDGAPEGVMETDFASNLAEMMARADRSGSLEQGQRLLQTKTMEGIQALGLQAGDLKAIFSAIHGHNNAEEDAALFNNLTPHQKLAAEKLHITFGIMTNYAYKHGHIELPMHRYVPWMVEHDDPSASRGVRTYLTLREALAPSARAVENRKWVLSTPDIQSEWDVANESQNMEFEEGAPTIAQRLQRAGPSRDEFEQQEGQKAENYADLKPFHDVFKQGEGNQFLLQKRREYGSLMQSRNIYQKKLEKIPGELGSLAAEIKGYEDDLQKIEAGAVTVKGQRGSGVVRTGLAQRAKELRNLIRTTRTKHRNLVKERDLAEERVKFYQDQMDTRPSQWVKQMGISGLANAEKWFRSEKDGTGYSRDEVRNNLSAQPGGRRLVGGFDLTGVSFARYLRQMNQARYRTAWESLAPGFATEGQKLAYGAASGLTLAEHVVEDNSDRPIALRGNINPGQSGTDAHQALLDHGYEMVMPAMGKKGALNYRPAIFGRKDLVGRYREMMQQARTAQDAQTAFAKTFLWKALLGVPRKLIMGSPAWHGKNVTGRAMVVFFQNPAIASQALFTTLKDRFLNPDMYYQTKLEHWAEGGMPSNKFNVGGHLNWLEQELSGQRNFGWQMRHPLQTLDNVHAQAAEGWFWKTVDDVGTMAYLVKKHELMNRRPWISEGMAGAIASEYSNNVAGMVNPLYMSKLWRLGRQMMFFAPGWWTTFARMVGMALPGSTRLSAFLKDSERFQALDPVKFHSLDLRHRTEMVRAHRSYFITMMGAALVTHDLMNYMFSGHHIWENQKGHEWDLEMDRFYAPEANLSTGGTDHVHLHSIQFYSQIADLMNAMGIGHDWGFMHQMGTDQFKKSDLAHKAGILGQALGQGFGQTAAGKLSTGASLGFGLATGTDLYSVLRDQKIQTMPRWETMLGALPGGYYAQRQIDQYSRAMLKAQYSGDNTAAAAEQAKILPTALKSAALQYLGLPSMYYSGDEPVNGYHFLSQTELATYLKSRNDIHSRKKALSDKLMQGTMSPSDWVVQNEMQTQQYLQLLSDTFGDQSTGKSLFDLRRQLYTKYHLDDPTISRTQQEYGLQQFESDWEQQIGHASPEARSQWWEVHTSMWTDADYLYWLTQQMRDAIMSHIDGEGGNHIRDAQARLGRQGLPLTPKATEELRQTDPYLWTYYQVMSQLGKTSLLGSLTAAYHDPFSNFTVFPDDQASAIQALQSAGAFPGNVPFIKASTMGKLGAEARGIGQGAAPEGGELAGTPEAQQAATGLSANAARQILATNPNLPPDVIKELEQVASGH